MSHTECWKFSISANITVAIIKVSVCWLEVLGCLMAYGAGSRWWVGCEGSDLWNREVSCYPVHDENVIPHQCSWGREVMKKVFKVHVVRRRGSIRSCIGHVNWERKRWKDFSDHVVRRRRPGDKRRGVEKSFWRPYEGERSDEKVVATT